MVMESQEEENGPPQKRTRHMGPTSRGSTSYARKRAVTACQVCRTRRTKCDNKKPKCSFCERTGAECVMAPDAMSTFDPASLRILERLDELQHQLQESIQTTFHSVSEILPLATAPTTHAQYQMFPGNLDAVLDWPAIKQHTTGLSEPLTDNQPAPDAIYPGASPRNADLDPSVYNWALDNFFQFVWIKNPVLEEKKTRRMVTRVFSEGIGWDQESCLALIITANGAIARSFFEESASTRMIEDSYGPVLFKAAQKRLGIVMANHGLITAQCLFFFGVYKMYMLQPFDAWRMFVQAVAACQQFKFLTNSSGPLSPTHIAHAEESIYWSCWKSERELRWILKLPDFGELANDHPKLFPSLPEGLCDEKQLEAWYFYLSEISLWRLSTKARKDIESFEHTPGVSFLDSLADLSQELEERAIAWSQSLAPTVRLDKVSDREESEVLRFILRGHVTSYYELIWWPFVDAVLNYGNTSRKVVSCASKGLNFHLDCLTINAKGFYYRHHGTWLMQQSCIRSSLVLLAASKNASSAQLLPSGWKSSVRNTVKMLEYWCNDTAGANSCIIALLNRLLKA